MNYYYAVLQASVHGRLAFLALLKLNSIQKGHIQVHSRLSAEDDKKLMGQLTRMLSSPEIPPCVIDISVVVPTGESKLALDKIIDGAPRDIVSKFEIVLC